MAADKQCPQLQPSLALTVADLKLQIFQECNFIQLYAEYLETKKGEFQSPRIANTEP